MFQRMSFPQFAFRKRQQIPTGSTPNAKIARIFVLLANYHTLFCQQCPIQALLAELKPTFSLSQTSRRKLTSLCRGEKRCAKANNSANNLQNHIFRYKRYECQVILTSHYGYFPITIFFDTDCELAAMRATYMPSASDDVPMVRLDDSSILRPERS